jgi:hypothetical protein
MIDAIIAIIIKVYYHARKSSRIMLDIYALTYLYHPIDDREIIMFTMLSKHNDDDYWYYLVKSINMIFVKHDFDRSRIMLDIYALTYLYRPIDDREIVMFT